ncbi:MAG: citryl-CoA lyase [Candidatus Heimdallarchaeota archaeon]|nr:citryl-CoA lyase [Candidatus Heimdallarchaeota archaeon]MDH5647059.1 citryl-CoA lyase [Candidatus Heimdallarchaeota archaeon]
MKFKTSISKITEEDVIIRENKLSDLIKKGSFSDTIFLLLNSRNPTPAEASLFNAILSAIIDHGMGTTSSLSSRFIMSGGNPVNAAVAGGILAIGDYHGGAIENTMRQLLHLADETTDGIISWVSEMISTKKAIFGFGHKVYKKIDPRVKTIIEIAEEISFNSRYIPILQTIESSIEKIKGRKIILNIDGLIAGLLLDMGFDPAIGKGIFIIGRVPGLVAQVVEEQIFEKPVRRIDEEEIIYDPDVHNMNKI